MNSHLAHSHFTISNDDFLLSTFIDEPIRWIDRYGWRPTCRTERRIVAWLPPRRTPNFFTNRRIRTPPQGYEIKSLGPRGWSRRVER